MAGRCEGLHGGGLMVWFVRRSVSGLRGLSGWVDRVGGLGGLIGWVDWVD